MQRKYITPLHRSYLYRNILRNNLRKNKLLSIGLKYRLVYILLSNRVKSTISFFHSFFHLNDLKRKSSITFHSQVWIRVYFIYELESTKTSYGNLEDIWWWPTNDLKIYSECFMLQIFYSEKISKYWLTEMKYISIFFRIKIIQRK